MKNLTVGELLVKLAETGKMDVEVKVTNNDHVFILDEDKGISGVSITEDGSNALLHMNIAVPN